MPSCPKSKVRTPLAGHTGAGSASHFLTGMKAVAGHPGPRGVRRDTTLSGLPWGVDSRLLRGCKRKALEVEARPGAGLWVESRSAQPARLHQGASRRSLSAAVATRCGGTWAIALVVGTVPSTV